MFINKLSDQSDFVTSVLVPTATEKLLEGLEKLGSPKAAYIRQTMLKNIVPDLSCHPSNYPDAWSYFLDAQACALLSKSVHFDFNKDPLAAAKENWIKAELICKETNMLLRSDSYRRDLSTNVSGILYHARDYLTRLLGPANIVFDTLKFSPGSTYTCRGRSGAFPIKFETDLCLYKHTPLDYVRQLGRNNLLWREAVIARSDKMTYIDHDEVSFVPKNYKTHRAICIGAGLNMHFQLHAASVIRRRLKRWGVDLRSVPDSHKQIVGDGCRDGTLSTIDLAMASDTVSLELVRAVLPDDWFTLLNQLRSKKTKMDGKVYTLEKFSAMGNGFTFELESIVFMAICYATQQLSGTKAFFSVFGDDIIVSSHIADSLVKNLSSVGFSTNDDKTFINGPFRESCGSDFFGKTDVRPIYLKEFSNDLEGIYQLANRIRDIATRTLNNEYCSSIFYDCWTYVLSWIPDNLRFFGPKSQGDSVIWCSRSEWIGCSIYKNGQHRIRTLERVYQLRSRVKARSWAGRIGVALYIMVERQEQFALEYNYPELMTNTLLIKKGVVVDWTDCSALSSSKGMVHRTTKYSLVRRQRHVLWDVTDHCWV